MVYNLGFDKFWARDDLNDPNAFLGYLACDEFSMLKPITEWIKADPVRDPKEKVSNGADARPFFLTILCSVTHDPYEVPEWFATPAKGPVERYRQAIFYTDKFLAPRAYSIIMFGALFCTLAVKFFHSRRIGLVNEYFGWILADIAVLLGIEVVLVAVCFRWPWRWVIRAACVIAAVVCTWSVMNAGWLIRTGTQILPTVLLPLFRDPLNTLLIIGVNLVKMPAVAVILLGPSAVALAFFFFVLAKPMPPA
ncbi:unnamed protein product, partial [marine sediment metagenome]